MHMLQTEGLLVKQAALRVGYTDPAHFSRAFHRFFGVWPRDAAPRKGGQSQKPTAA